MWIKTNIHSLGSKQEQIETILKKKKLSKYAVARVYVQYLEKEHGVINEYFESQIDEELKTFDALDEEERLAVLTYGMDMLKEFVKE